MFNIDKLEKLIKVIIGIIAVNICGVFILYSFIYDDLNYYSIVPEILISTFGFVVGVMVIARKEKGISSHIGIGFLILSFIGYFKGLILLEDSKISLDNSLYIALDNTSIILEVFIISLAVFFKKLNFSILKSSFYFLVLELSLFFINYNFLEKINSIIIFLVYILSILGIILMIKENRVYNQRINVIPNIIIYLVIISIHTIMYKLPNINETPLILICFIIRYLAYFILYEGMAKRLIEQMYLNKKDELISYNIMFNRLNKVLQKRNIVLNEINSVNSRNKRRYLDIVSSMSDGVMIFNSNKLYFSNDFMKNILKEIYGIDDIDKELELKEIINIFLDKNSNFVLSYKEKFDDFIKYKHLIKPKKINKEFEMYHIRLNLDETVVFLKDISDIKSYYRIKKEYNECIEREKIKNEFYSNVSHELRTPINVISSALQLNEYYIINKEIDSIKTNTKRIKQNCLRLIRTINNFIDANKISEGYLIPEKYNYNIVSIIENISNSSLKYIKKINNKLILEKEDDEIIFPFDKDMIERVLLNLLSNSVKYGEKDKEIKIKIKKDLNSNLFILNLENNSGEISSKFEPYLFDEFTRLNKNYNRKKEGSGLGLFLSKEIISAHDGTINFNRIDEKNIFTIKLPLKNINDYSFKEEVEINCIEEKVDLEFSDIYI